MDYLVQTLWKGKEMKIKIELEDDGANACDRFVRAIEKLVMEFNKIQYPKMEQNNENTNSSEH